MENIKMPYEEVAEDLTLRGLMIAYDYDCIRTLLDEQYSNYDCKLIEQKLKRFTLNRDVQYLMTHYKYNFQQAIDKLVDTRILRLW